MDLLDLLRLMFRRWYVTVPVLLGALGAATGLGISIQPEYKTSAAVLLVPPTTAVPAPAPGASPQPGNPWLRVGENAMAQAVQISASSHDFRDRVRAAGGDPDYEVGLVTRSSILTIDVTAGNRAAAAATVAAVTRLISEEVAGRQAEYRPRSGEQITTEVLDPGRNVVPSRSNVLRAQIVVAGVGALLAAALAVLFDAWARRRSAAGRRRRDARTVGDTGHARVVPQRPQPPAGPAGTAPPAVVRPPLNPAVRPKPVSRPQSDDTELLTVVRPVTDDADR
ncbi:hypothetical protein [Micromonospora echinofusca]|uniref:Capsular polysaccharide biosynthesis protein n=1 Tax=Micromonospora echinofusca TaxID=47858 RepID=A0ABS3VL12_MICEH|nr:hypothetical protein [Micromonospora echinofusca]MBO4205223.1 hypothetical protein [Micromonospora echinofusca]